MAKGELLGSRVEYLRKKAGLSQAELSRMIGIQRVTLSKIENNERKLFTDELIKLSQIFNISIDEIVDPEIEPEVVVVKEIKDREPNLPDIRVNVPQKNIKKFKEVLLYILNKVGSKPNVGETVIYKLLYFIDFNYYEKYEKQLIGATYIKNNYGPTPVEFKKVTDQMIEGGEIEKVESKHFKYPQRKYLPIKEADLSVLNALELKMIEEVLEKLSDMNANDISDYSHNDVPWISAKKNGKIEYESVFYRTPEFSVRKYE